MTKIGDEINSVFAEILAEHTYGDIQPGDIFVQDVMKALSVSTSRAASILDCKVRDGKLIKVKVKKEGGGNPINAYRLPE